MRILIADDHGIVRGGMRLLIDRQPDMQVVAEAADGRAAWELARELRPDVAVIDVSMPVVCGAEATARVHRDCPTVKVLALTVHEDASYLRQLFEAGAVGYVLKRAATEELVRAIRAVASGGVYIDPQMASQVVGGFVARPAGRGEPTEAALTEREIEVVRLLARGYINREIAAQLDLSAKTVEVHKARALEKLGLRSRADLVQYAMRRGWLQEP